MMKKIAATSRATQAITRGTMSTENGIGQTVRNILNAAGLRAATAAAVGPVPAIAFGYVHDILEKPCRDSEVRAAGPAATRSGAPAPVRESLDHAGSNGTRSSDPRPSHGTSRRR